MFTTRVGALLAVCSAPGASGHGWLANPPSRNSQSGPKNGYCPHCGNGNGICGDGNQWPAGSDYVNFYSGPVVTWTEGSIVAVEVRVTAHHKGHYEFSICDQVISSGLSNAQACLDKHILERVSSEEAGVTDCQPGDGRSVCQPLDPRHKERYYLPPGSGYDKIYLKLPAGLKCDACTMQWRWWSANSCIPAADYACFKGELEASGYSSASWGLGGSCPGGGCNRCGCGEEFRNCVDISIVGNGGGGPPAPTTAAPTPTTTSGFLAPTASPVTTAFPTTGAPTPQPFSCVAVPVEGEASAPSGELCTKACSSVPAGVWPCQSSGPCKCDEPAVTERPTTPPTTTPSTCAACYDLFFSRACIWTDGECYPMLKDMCVSTAGAVWCGGN